MKGVVRVDGAKNSALPIMAASLVIPEPVQLFDVPRLVDVRTMTALLRSLGAVVSDQGRNRFSIDASAATGRVADYELVRQMRASICVLGPLLARFGEAKVSLPGGCNIGHRPIDLHLKGLSELGADMRIENGYIVASCKQLVGGEISLIGEFGSTVTGTCNVLVAACVAQGRTVIRGAAREPEVVDLGRFLVAAGADIQGLGTSVIEVNGIEQLCGVSHQIVPDRIEAATFAIAAAATRGKVVIPNAPVHDMASVIEVLQRIGVQVDTDASGMTVSGTEQMRPADIIAAPFPGLPTDCQAQMLALMTTLNGNSSVTDSVFPDRFMHASELMRMGARISRCGGAAQVQGGVPLSGANVMASDLRASAALVIAALAARGTTCIRRIYHLDRGYAGLETKLTSLGAEVKRVSEQSTGTPHFAKDRSGRSANLGGAQEKA